MKEYKLVITLRVSIPPAGHVNANGWRNIARRIEAIATNEQAEQAHKIMEDLLVQADEKLKAIGLAPTWGKKKRSTINAGATVL